MRFVDKVVVVTGSSSGIGLAIAAKFLQQGATVWINGRTENNLLAAKEQLIAHADQQRINHYVADCTDLDALQGFCNVVRQESGKVDVLVANIGDGRSVPDAMPSEEHWAKVWNTNFNSALHTSRVFLPLLSSPGANILFISSIVALEAFGAPIDYSTAKSAVNALAKNLSRKLAPQIRVNTIAPGNILFDGGAWADKLVKDKDKVQEMLNSQVPLKRFGRPEEIANAVSFLCSDEASFITGSTLVVDGGQMVSGY